MTSETHGCGTAHREGRDLSTAQKYCIKSFRALAEDLYLRAPSTKVVEMKGNEGKGKQKARVKYIDETATIMSKLTGIAISAPDGYKKAKACADLLLYLHTSPETAKVFVGKIEYFTLFIGSDDWVSAFDRVLKCNPGIDPLKILALTLESLTRSKPAKPAKFNPNKEASGFVAALNDFTGSLSCGAFEVQLRLRREKSLKEADKEDGPFADQTEKFSGEFLGFGRR